jgi:predicted alpha/beta hydrolase
MSVIAGLESVARVTRVSAADGAASELLLVDAAAPRHWLYWLPAMGVPAKHYLPLASALAAHGIAVALHEWRGIGSSDRRAGWRQDWNYRTLLCQDIPAGLAATRAAWPGARGRIGGHSLGGQLACMFAGLAPQEVAGLVLVATGMPYWRHFRHAWSVGAAYVLAPLLATVCGHLPGRRIGFGGNEARGVIGDWARSGRSGRYAAAGLGDLEAGMATLAAPLLALRMRDDWLGPEASLDGLLRKLPRATVTRGVITPHDLHGPADHFGWMKTPEPVAAHIAHWLAAPASAPAPTA